MQEPQTLLACKPMLRPRAAGANVQLFGGTTLHVCKPRFGSGVLLYG